MKQRAVWDEIGRFARRHCKALSVGCAATFVALIIGCGGSGDSNGGSGATTGTAPTGNEAIRSSSVASTQSLGAGIAFPFAAVVASAPSGSHLKNAAVFSKAYSPYVRGTRAKTLSFVSSLNLYTDGGVETAGKIVVSYFSDKAGTMPAGTMSVVAPNQTFDYPKFPVTVNIAVSVTGGNIPCEGAAQIVFEGATGKNTLKGTLTLKRNGEVVSVDMGLTDALGVSGTISVSEDKTTINGTNVAGVITGDLTCDFTTSPQNYSGHAKLNLNTGAITLTFVNPANAVSSLDSSGDLNITYPDGSKQTITNPFGALLQGVTTGSTATGTTATTATATTATATATTATATTATGTTATGTTSGVVNGLTLYTATPIASKPQLITSVSSDGRMVGQDSKGVWSYWSSPLAQPQPLAADPNSSDILVWGVNNKGHIVAAGHAISSGQLVPVFWTAYNKTPTHMTEVFGSSGSIGSAMYLNDNDALVVDYDGLYYASPTSLPVGNGLKSFKGLSDVGTALSQIGVPSLWPSLPPHGNPIGYTGQELGYLGLNGTLALSNGQDVSEVLPGNHQTLLKLQEPTTYAFAWWPQNVGPTGHILGYAYDLHVGSNVDGVLWKNSTSAPIVFDGIGGHETNVCLYETTNGDILLGVGLAIAGPYAAYYLLSPK